MLIPSSSPLSACHPVTPTPCPPPLPPPLVSFPELGVFHVLSAFLIFPTHFFSLPPLFERKRKILLWLNINFYHFLSFLTIDFFISERKKEHEREGQRERERKSQADSVLSAELHVGVPWLDLMTLRLQPRP